MPIIVLIIFSLMFVGGWILAGLSLKRRRPSALAAVLTCGATVLVPLVGVLIIYLMPHTPEVGDDLLSAELVRAGRWLRISLGVLIPAAFFVSLAIFTRARIEIGTEGSSFD